MTDADRPVSIFEISSGQLLYVIRRPQMQSYICNLKNIFYHKCGVVSASSHDVVALNRSYRWKVASRDLSVVSIVSQSLFIVLNCVYSAYHFSEKGKK